MPKSRDVSKNPFRMFFGKINGADLTGNAVMRDSKFASQSTRYNSLDHLVGDQSSYFGNDNDYDFFKGIKADPVEKIMDEVEFYNSHLDLNYDLPSTVNVGRFNAQNGGRKK